MTSSEQNMNTPVESWFGKRFEDLDPLIQNLHRVGGQLQGNVDLQFGSGLAGIIGRRVAQKMGLPTTTGVKALEVTISHKNGSLVWSRQFDKDSQMVSIFTPNGIYPGGFWREETGVVSMDLGVEIINGGWYWQQRAIRLRGLRLPLWLFPSSHAYKKVVDGRYEFSVSISLPVLGKLVSYSGTLKAQPQDTMR